LADLRAHLNNPILALRERKGGGRAGGEGSNKIATEWKSKSDGCAPESNQDLGNRLISPLKMLAIGFYVENVCMLAIIPRNLIF
jgi:hypothetical protein